jgi:hypothetical protein
MDVQDSLASFVVPLGTVRNGQDSVRKVVKEAGNLISQGPGSRGL